MKLHKMFCLTVTALLLSACEHQSAELQKLEQLVAEIGESVQQVTEDLKPTVDSAHSASSAEVEKLFVWEYKVVDIDSESDRSAVEGMLAGYGKDRWECFWVQSIGSSTRFHFKRRPSTPLRYVPRWFP